MGQMIVQRHGVSHNLKPLLQRAVVLAVGPFLSVVDQPKNLPGIAVVFSGAVNLQLHPEVPAALTEELRFRLVVIVVYLSGAGVVAVAGVAPGPIVLVILVVGVILKDDAAAVFSGGVVGIKTGLAPMGIFVAGAAI